MSTSRKWILYAIAIAMVFVVAGNALATPAPPPQQNQDQNQTQNNLWVVPVAILVGGIVVYLVWGLVESGGI